MPKVYIVCGNYQYRDMFVKFGWDIADTVSDADLVQFTGGEDVTPALYDQAVHYSTNFNTARDKQEAVILRLAQGLEKPVAGICRGGQFLNVMMGGSMWQDVDNHCVGKHVAYDTQSGESLDVTSTHHQMMIPGKNGKVVLVAKESKCKTKCGKQGSGFIYCEDDRNPDVEAVHYPEQGAFCFQPHPEFGADACPDLATAYFDYLEEFFDLKSKR